MAVLPDLDAAAERPDVPGEGESKQEFPVPGKAEVSQSGIVSQPVWHSGLHCQITVTIYEC